MCLHFDPKKSSKLYHKSGAGLFPKESEDRLIGLVKVTSYRPYKLEFQDRKIKRCVAMYPSLQKVPTRFIQMILEFFHSPENHADPNVENAQRYNAYSHP